MNKKNKTSEILKYLKRYKKITSLQAIEKFGSIRLGGIIFNLRKKGYDILTETKSTKDRYGNPCNYAVYILKEE